MLIHVECVRMPRFQFNLLCIGDSFGLKPVKWTSATCRLNLNARFSLRNKICTMQAMPMFEYERARPETAVCLCGR